MDEEFSNQILATMLYLDSIDDNKRLYFYINGPGGDVSFFFCKFKAFADVYPFLVSYLLSLSDMDWLLLQLTPSLAIYDTMQSLKSPVGTHCVGYAYNLAGFILAAGEKVMVLFSSV